MKCKESGKCSCCGKWLDVTRHSIDKEWNIKLCEKCLQRMWDYSHYIDEETDKEIITVTDIVTDEEVDAVTEKAPIK